MYSKTIKLLVPLAAAAAIVLAVGLWPEKAGHGTGSGRVYALSDVPGLLRQASMLHERRYFHLPHAAPGMQCRRHVYEQWVDLTHGRWASLDRDGGLVEGIPPAKGHKPDIFCDWVCDGEYEMSVYHFTKEVSFARYSPFRKRFELRKRANNLIEAFAPADAEFALMGHELMNGLQAEVWQRVTPPQDPGLESCRFTLWFLPSSGEIARCQYELNGPSTGGQWSIPNFSDAVERDTIPPEGTFSTEPPAGYTLENTKQTATLRTMQSLSLYYDPAPHRIRAHFGFVLPDRSVLLCWSLKDRLANEAAAFAGLVPGGPLPQLPARITGLLRVPSDRPLAYTGRHLAWTQQSGRVYEWALYVADRKPPLGSNFRVVFEIDGQDSNTIPGFPQATIPGGEVLAINSAADFEDFVRAAMAELSDSPEPAAHLTYEGVNQLCAQIRASLQK